MQKVFFLTLLLFVTSTAYCESESIKGASFFMKQSRPPKVSQVYEITLRGIQGDGLFQGSRSADISLEEDLEFLRQKLLKLPFASYKLVTKSTDIIRSNYTRTFTLTDGQLVNLQPIDTTGKTVTMWMRWIDKEGMEILDTRIHFACDETMLAGVDSDQSKGLILAITVSPHAIQSVE